MRIMGLDLGEKTIGVAVSDPLGLTAQGREVLHRTNTRQDMAYLQALIHRLQIHQVVVGLPWNMDGTLGFQGQKTLDFVEGLKKKVSIPVKTYDERLSTREAQQTLISADMGRKKRRAVLDKVAAVIILQSYLDRENRREADQNDR